MQEYLKKELQRLRERTYMSFDYSGYGHLYHHFDHLVQHLDKWKAAIPQDSAVVQSELLATIDFLLTESQDNHYGSSTERLLYSARSFYCADKLSQYIVSQNEIQELQYKHINVFRTLSKTGITALLPDEVFDKYFDLLKWQPILDITIKACIIKSSIFRNWNIDEVYVAYQQIKLTHKLITAYIQKFEDHFSMGRWLADINIAKFVNALYHSDVQYPARHHRELYLSNSITLILELFYTFFQHDVVELLSRVSKKNIIEALEMMNDSDFKDFMTTISPYLIDTKVQHIFEHFADDDEDWVVRLCSSLQAEAAKKQPFYDIAWAVALSTYQPRCQENPFDFNAFRTIIETTLNGAFGVTQAARCRWQQDRAILQKHPLPWSYLYDCMKISHKDFVLILPFEIANDLRCHITVKERLQVYGWYDETSDAIYVFAYTGKSEDEENTSPAYDGYGRYDTYYEIVEGSINKEGIWIKQPSKRYIF